MVFRRRLPWQNVPLVFCLLFLSKLGLSLTHVDYYQEGSYVESQKYFSLSQKLTWKMPFSRNFYSYLSMGSEYLINYSEAIRSPNREIHQGYGSFGLGYAYKIFVLSQEFRFKESSRLDDGSHTFDLNARSLFLVNHFADALLLGRNDLRLFSEFYSETLYNDVVEKKLEKNIIHTSFEKAGLRYLFLPSLTADAYLEPKISKDKLRLSYNNFLSFKNGVRFNGSWKNLTVTLSLSRSYTYSLAANYDDELNNHSPYWGNQVLFTLGGMI